MMESDSSFCAQAVAYLKTEISDEEPAITLAKPDEPVLRRLGNGMLAAYVVDEGTEFKLVQYRHLFAAGLTEAELHELAVANLLDLANKRLDIRPYGDIFAMLLDGNFEASLLLADSLWDEKLVHLAPNGFLAAAPARDVLAFRDAASESGIAEPRAVIAGIDAAGADHALSPLLLRRVEKSWIRDADQAASWPPRQAL
jgi:hypothetical protein